MANTVKERFEERLKAVGLSKAQVARRLGIEAQNISGWLRRNSIPKKYRAEVCEMLKCEPLWLVYGSNTQASDAIDRTMLAQIMSSVQNALDEVDLDWPVEKVTALSADLYALYVQTGNAPNVTQAVKLAVLQQSA